MDLARNRNADFTKWVVSAGFLTEPFVLIDVGVQGGENDRWRPFGDCLVVHGFDPIEEVVQQLVEVNRGRPNRHYHCMAVGNMDGEQTFYFHPANPTASSMYQQSTGRFDVDTSEQRRMVPIRRLDSLLGEGIIPIADYIKIDVEGFEQDVLLGARELLRGGFLPCRPRPISGSVRLIRKPILQQSRKLPWTITLCFSISCSIGSRAPLSSVRSFAKDLSQSPSRTVSAGRRQWMSYSRAISSMRLVIWITTRAPPPPVTISQLIKSMIICELHALNDVALDTVERFADRLGAHLDVDRAVRLLADPECVTNEYRKQLQARKRAYEGSTTGA